MRLIRGKGEGFLLPAETLSHNGDVRTTQSYCDLVMPVLVSSVPRMMKPVTLFESTVGWTLWYLCRSMLKIRSYWQLQQEPFGNALLAVKM